MRPAVELSYLDEDCQRDIVDEIDMNDATPSHDQTIRMRKFFEEGKLTTEVIQANYVGGEAEPKRKDYAEYGQGREVYSEKYQDQPEGGLYL